MQPETDADQARADATVRVQRLASLDELQESVWSDLNPGGTPFLDFRFLSQLETGGLVGEASGWLPAHLVARQGAKVIAAMPLYEKFNSFGEFVFDWAWADAYQRMGRRYFPKLVCAVPYSPVPGARILAADAATAALAIPSLLAAARELADERQASSLHVLFAPKSQARSMLENGMHLRADCRYLWKNSEFADFSDFLATFNARQRKNIQSERRKVAAAGVRCKWITGAALAELDWTRIHALCARTFYERGHAPYLDAGFFAAMAARMPDKMLVNLAYRGGDLIAAAIFFRDSDSLYGRYWGCNEQVSCLHFESCYYQGIEYAISHGLEYFDPGTQGEHKLRRGFMPVPSWSLHWFADRQLGDAIARWLAEERRLVGAHIDHCREKMPFRTAADHATDWP